MKGVNIYLKKCLPVVIFFGVMIRLLTQQANAQITLDQTFDTTTIGYFYLTDIGTNEWKYVFQNPNTNSFSLFDRNFSPYLLNIQIPVIDSIKNGFNVIYISRKLVDCDTTNIEYAYNYPADLHHKFRIFGTDGRLVYELDSANCPFQVGRTYGGAYKFQPIKNTPEGAKLFLQKSHNNGLPERHVFTLCRTLKDATMQFRHNYDVLKIYPDKKGMKLNFEFIQPNNQIRYLLMIVDNEAKLVKQVVMEANYALDVKNFSNGAYFFTLVGKDRVYQSGKFIIKK